MNQVNIAVSEEQTSERLDKFLSTTEPEWSRTQVQQWVKDGLIEVNGKQVKANYKVQAGDQIKVEIPDPEALDVEAESMDLDIYYEDEDVLVVNKPRGMVVHPAPGHVTGTLVNGLMAHCNDLSGINGVMRPGIVHRIDKDTSGLLMVAKMIWRMNHSSISWWRKRSLENTQPLFMASFSMILERLMHQLVETKKIAKA